MGWQKPKLPECKCKLCIKWNVDINELHENIRWLDANPWMGKKYQQEARQATKGLRFEFGCELCGQNHLCVFFVPNIVQQFFHIQRLCQCCRNRINSLQRDLQWPICWSTTSDDEIKWFLIGLILHDFQWHFTGNRGNFIMWMDCCVQGAHAQRAPVKPEPYKWPEMEWLNEPYEPPDLKIELKPEFRRPRVRARIIDVTTE